MVFESARRMPIDRNLSLALFDSETPRGDIRNAVNTACIADVSSMLLLL